MMLADSKVSNLSPLLVEEKHLFPDFPPAASHFIPVEQSGSILFNVPVKNEEKNVNEDANLSSCIYFHDDKFVNLKTRHGIT